MTASRTTRFAACALAALLVGALAVPDADARRLGGKRSFGQQSGNVYNREAPARQQDAPPARQADAGQKSPDAAPGAAPAGAAAGGNRWLGPVAGLAAGLGLAALFSHMGFGAGLAGVLGNVLLVGLLAFGAMLLWRMFRGGGRPAYAGAGTARQPVTVQHPANAGDAPATWREASPVADAASAAGSVPARAPVSSPAAVSGPVSVTGEPLAPLPGDAASSSRATWTVPADFDVPGFVRQAKVEFVRLQAAWDAGDLEDIRSFTTPQMFAEIRMDLADRGDARNVTEVVEVEAELLGIEMRERDALASVRFHGSIRESEGAPAEAFEEVWNLVKPLSGRSGWLLAGIQQTGEAAPAA